MTPMEAQAQARILILELSKTPLVKGSGISEHAIDLARTALTDAYAQGRREQREADITICNKRSTFYDETKDVDRLVRAVQSNEAAGIAEAIRSQTTQEKKI